MNGTKRLSRHTLFVSACSVYIYIYVCIYPLDFFDTIVVYCVEIDVRATGLSFLGQSVRVGINACGSPTHRSPNPIICLMLKYQY